MADRLTPSASTNPFSTDQPEEQGVPRRNCPSPHNPFSLPARASSPGNPFAPPIAPSAAPPDEVLPFSDVCEPMQSIKLDIMFPELATNDRPIATSNTANDVTATYGESSDFPERYLSKTQEDVQTNHVADGPSSGMSSWGNNTNNSNLVDKTVESGFGDGFGDDFGSLSHTDVIFKTGFMDNNFKAVGVTAEEDDLWSSSFIMEDPSPDGETLHSSGDQESTNQGEETRTRSEDAIGMQFHSYHTPGAVPEVDEEVLGLSNTKVRVEVDILPDLAEGPWDPWSPEDTKEQLCFQDRSTSDSWPSRGPTLEQSHWIENLQESGVEDMFSMQGSGRWGVDAKVDAEKERGKEVDESGQDPWAPCKNSKDPTDYKAAKLQALDLSAPMCNPFSSEDSFSSSLQNASSPFQDDPSSPFHPQYDPTSNSSDSSSFPFPGASQLQVEAVSGRSDPWSPCLIPHKREWNHPRGSSPFHSQNDPTSNSTNSGSFTYQQKSELQVDALGTHNDPWSPSLTPDNQDVHGSRRSRSPNPFTPVEDTANPFLHDLDLLPGKLGRINQRQVSVKLCV